MLVKNKKKRYNSFRRRKERNYDGIYLAIFYSTSVSDLYELREEDIRLNGFGSNWEIVDCDEDWVKLSREGIKQHRVTKLVRIEDVELIQQLR